MFGGGWFSNAAPQANEITSLWKASWGVATYCSASRLDQALSHFWQMSILPVCIRLSVMHTPQPGNLFLGFSKKSVSLESNLKLPYCIKALSFSLTFLWDEKQIFLSFFAPIFYIFKTVIMSCLFSFPPLIIFSSLGYHSHVTLFSMPHRLLTILLTLLWDLSRSLWVSLDPQISLGAWHLNLDTELQLRS